MDPNKDRARRRARRKHHIRKRLFGTKERPRLTVTRSAKHLYCQLIDDLAGVTLCSASSVAKELRDKVGVDGRNRKGATLIGAQLAGRAKALGIAKVSFDRNGYKYQGRLAALCDAIRKEGIEV